MQNVLFVRKYTPREIFEHISSQSMPNWGFHHIASNFFFQISYLQCACVNYVKQHLSNVL